MEADHDKDAFVVGIGENADSNLEGIPFVKNNVGEIVNLLRVPGQPRI
jgi:hypothetical protein